MTDITKLPDKWRESINGTIECCHHGGNVKAVKDCANELVAALPVGTYFDKLNSATWPKLSQEIIYRFPMMDGKYSGPLSLNAGVFSQKIRSRFCCHNGGIIWWPAGDLYHTPEMGRRPPQEESK